ncbi:ion transporter [Phaeodactylibacter xiamenensis]|jgi:voltage-gated potassium channel|uniref:Ion transporter n=1 Tax=Phaeodactylibacter xiamenensis TaxID=1524460 RepID=A0A098S941_9BACT|nr:ion transporter [Phaeodactylibacter xiamenensis]KGE89079.1 ion transporter [Phaeodactylibacter xiamenensis]MCR9050658.1 ion transporter [bacterium]
MPQPESSTFRDKLHEIIFEADTPEGKAFDVILLILIAASVLTVMLESIEPLQRQYATLFTVVEWVFTVFFTIEYLLRLYCVLRPMKYATSFFGIIDLLAILPSYLALFLPTAQYFLIIRAFRLIRIFRIFKMAHFINEGDIIIQALRASRAKITVFLTFVSLLVIIIGALMYLIEGGSNEGFSSIPRGVYWSVVTLTTVGYGDITPRTELGQLISAVVMILGYAIIAVPTGIVSAEFVKEYKSGKANTQACRYCGQEGHDHDAIHCKYCGEQLNP